jgi:WD40 repeat protein
MSQMDEVSIAIDDEIKIDTDEYDIDENETNDSDKDNIDNYKNDKPPHNGKPITNIELSPGGKYLVSYSREDDSIFGWNVENINEVNKPEPEFHVDGLDGYVKCIRVSDDKKLMCYHNGISK